MRIPKYLAVLLTLLTLGGTARAQALDPSFIPTALESTTSYYYSHALVVCQTDGKLIIAGHFDFVNAQPAPYLRRLLADGTLDVSFNPGGMGPNQPVAAMLLQPDGKLLVAGDFTTYNGLPLPHLVRLLPDGTPDPTFVAGGLGAIVAPTCLARQADGKILIGDDSRARSSMASYANGLTRLLPDGRVDGMFALPAAITLDRVYSLLVQSDGNIVVGGNATDSSGVWPTRQYLTRLRPDGSKDGSFRPAGPYGVSRLTSLAQQPDGKLLIGGSFSWSYSNHDGPANLVRFHPDGTLDTSFVTSIRHSEHSVQTIWLDAAGRVVVGGATYSPNRSSGYLTRLGATGAPDATFVTGAGPSLDVTSIAPDGAGGYYLAGNFRAYDGVPQSGLAHITAAGALDAAFRPVLTVRGYLGQVVPLASGQLLVVGMFTHVNRVAVPAGSGSVRRLQADGSLDTTFVCPAVGNLCGVRPTGEFYVSTSPSPSSPGSGSLTRYLASGAVDTSFQRSWWYRIGISQVIEQSPDTLIVTGYRPYFMGGGNFGPTLYRLNGRGIVDPQYQLEVRGNSGTNAWPQSGGRVIVRASQSFDLRRLHADGTHDSTFAMVAPNGAITTILALPHDQLLINGTFTEIAGRPAPAGIARIQATGALDTTFQATTSGRLLARQADGKLLLLTGTGTAAHLMRLLPTGAPDSTFAAVPLPTGDAEGFVAGAAVQPTDGKLLVWGTFRTVAGEARYGLARLLTTAPPTVPPTAPARLTLYPNPARGTLTVQLPAAVSADITVVRVFDLSGRTVRTAPRAPTESAVSVSLAGLGPGIYLVRAGTAVQRLMVE